MADDDSALACLHRNGYYRLSAYWYPFRKIVDRSKTDEFLEHSRFEDARRLYVFDKQLKLHLLDAIVRVEIAVRVVIAMCLGNRDTFAHLKPEFFLSKFTASNDKNEDCASNHEIWINKYQCAVTNSKDAFVKHHYDKFKDHLENYGIAAQLPIWIAIELWDFGMLSKLYSGMLVEDCTCVASRFEVPSWKVMSAWLHTLNYIRNVIAHHGRLWNLHLAIAPKSPAIGSMPGFDEVFSVDGNNRVYTICCILSHFSKVINSESEWGQELKKIIDDFPAMPHANTSHMGFPNNWKAHRFCA